MGRAELIKVAKDTIDFTNEFMEKNADYSPAKVTVFSPERLLAIETDEDEFFERAFYGSKGAECYVVNADSFFVASLLDNALVMNFANAHKPGGGFLTGATAQEESLCRCSTLYASISNWKAQEMYDYNNSLADPCGSDYMLLSRNVYVFRDSYLNKLKLPFWTSVVTVPAPNKNGRASGVKQIELDIVMIERLRRMLLMAAHEGYRNLVLGAWGTGAFGHDTETVAGYFNYLFYEEGFNEFFETVVFAILGDDEKVKIFKDVFGENIIVGYPKELTVKGETNGGYYELAYDMPLCNYTEEITESHICFAQGVTCDGIPFDAELTCKGNVGTLCVVMPAIFDPNLTYENQDIDDTLIGYHFEVESEDVSILDIGMIDEGQEDDYDVIRKYIDFLTENEIISFSSNIQNGAVFYRVDELGNDLAKILVILSEGEDTWAYTGLKFKCDGKPDKRFEVM